ncbi:MAG: hypothetical protein KatS3mg111_3214 [Pirellulaceae bacterium]|nr:MAG: hypothetical protein KatS3mg111_3214 [Pirellulaceae bacterium]
MTNETNLHRILLHPRRFHFMMGLSLALGAFVVWPAYQRVVDTARRERTLREEAAAIRAAVARIEPLQHRTAALRQQIDEQFHPIDEPTAHRLRSECVKLLFQHHLAGVQIRLGEATRVPWKAHLNPWNTASDESPQEESPRKETEFVLVERKLNVSAEGKPHDVDRLLHALEQMHPFAKATRLQIRDKGETDSVAMELEMSLFDLEKDSAG